MNNTESKLITAVLQDKQIHVLLQANVDNLLRTHGDIWNFIRLYFENNKSLPPAELVTEIDCALSETDAIRVIATIRNFFIVYVFVFNNEPQRYGTHFNPPNKSYQHIKKVPLL